MPVLSETIYTDESVKTEEGTIIEILAGIDPKIYTSAVIISSKDTRDQE